MTLAWRNEPFEAVMADESGGNTKTPQSEYLPSGRFAVVDQGKELIAGYLNDQARLCRVRLPAIVFGDHTRCFKYIDFPFCMGADGVKVLRPKIDADVKYLYHYFRQLQLTDGGYDRHFKYLKRKSVVIPPLAEQRRIAEILDKADALPSKRRAAVAMLDTLTRSIFSSLFHGASLQYRTLGELLNNKALLLHKDGNHGSLYPRAEDFAESGIPFLSARSITDDGLIDDDLVQRLRPENAARLRIGWISAGDVLLAHNASVGKVALYDGRFERALIGTSLTAFRPNTALLDPEYCAAALRSSEFQAQLQKNMAQTTRNQVPITAQRELRIPVPPLSSQHAFAVRSKAVGELKARYRASLAQLDALFASLQHRAFRGEL